MQEKSGVRQCYDAYSIKKKKKRGKNCVTLQPDMSTKNVPVLFVVLHSFNPPEGTSTKEIRRSINPLLSF